MKSFKNFIFNYKENVENENSNWKKEFIKLEKGFVPSSNLKIIIQAFLDGDEVLLMKDTSKEIKMPKKDLYLCGGSARDFLTNKTQKNYNLITNATPQQIILILKNSGFSKDNQEKNWFVRDDKIITVVNGDEFEIDTFKKEKNNTFEYTDDMVEDSKRRDLTINALYIELTRPDGENNKLYDPSKRGWYDISHGIISFVENPEEHIEKNPISILRTIRFYSQHGQVKINKEIENIIKESRNKLSNIPYEKIIKEFMKGLFSKDIDSIKFIKNYNNYKLFDFIFPNLDLYLSFPNNMNVKDKLILISWILQNNSIESLKENLRNLDQYERRFILFMNKLKEYNPARSKKYSELKIFSGVSDQQIKDWANLFQKTNPRIYKKIMSFYKFLKK